MILQKILTHKRAEIEGLKKTANAGSMAELINLLPPAAPFSSALKKVGRVALIAEIKGASPSRGVIRKHFSPPAIARIYSENGADAISVLTDRHFFSGQPEHITEVSKTTTLPILRKDFIIDPLQVYQARLLGADAVLLICAALPQKDLEKLLRLTAETGMEALVEVHCEIELERALTAGAEIIGINNRNLNTFVTDINTTLRLADGFDGSSKTLVSESGIRSKWDIEILKSAGIDAVLVGEAIMSAGDMAAKVRELAFGE